MSGSIPTAGPSGHNGFPNGSHTSSWKVNSSEIEEKKRRAYKACLNCRSKKAKCDLGELDNPKEPPCARCRRESKECVFAESRRGGKVVRKKDKTDQAQDAASDQSTLAFGQDVSQTMDGIALDPGSSTLPDIPLHSDSFGLYAPSPALPHSSSFVPSLSPSQGQYFELLNQTGEREVYTLPSTATPQSVHHERPTSSGEPSAKRRKVDSTDAHHLRTSTGTESFASASIHNPADALQLLFQAADASSKAEGEDQPRSVSAHPSYQAGQNQVPAASPHSNFSTSAASEGGPANSSRVVQEAPQLSDFLLVSKGIITRDECVHLIAAFFKHTHPIFPLIPSSKVPRTESKIAEFAVEESHLAVAIIVIASRIERKLEIHAASWDVMQDLISSLLFGKGKGPTIGSVEALLILSENPPRQSEPGTDKETIVAEQILSWNLVGTAIRFGYFLSLDQTTFETVELEQPHENSVVASQLLQRQRLAWTYCYLFDRQISIRLGKAFWSRGPGLCFQQPRMSDGLTPAASNFPLMRPIAGVQDDYASLLQAYIELTQIMTAAHDILFHSKDRTIALARSGSYYPYLDDFTRSLNSFKTVWETKKWTTCPLTDIVWITFHYIRQYVYGFAFQAHVQRATAAYSDAMPQKINLFERGTSGSPDAKFIFEAIDAARELLRICIESLFPSGALFYLPWRFFVYFCYAGVFVLKVCPLCSHLGWGLSFARQAVVVEAVPLSEQKKIVRMVKQLTLCLASVSPDDQHPGVRYARLLNDLIRTFSRGREDLVSQVATPYEARPPDFSASASTAQPMANVGPVYPSQPPFGNTVGPDSFNTSAFMPDGLPDLLNAPNPPWIDFDTTFNATNDLNWQMADGSSGMNAASEDVLSSMFFSGETLDSDFWQNFGAV